MDDAALRAVAAAAGLRVEEERLPSLLTDYLALRRRADDLRAACQLDRHDEAGALDPRS